MDGALRRPRWVAAQLRLLRSSRGNEAQNQSVSIGVHPWLKISAFQILRMSVVRGQ
jgi:hypothetical protein